MRNLFTAMINADNYVTVITISIILVLTLFMMVVLFARRNTVIAISTCCVMAVAAITCITSISVSIPYIQVDIDSYVTNYTNNMIDDQYSIDSSMVNLNFNF